MTPVDARLLDEVRDAIREAERDSADRARAEGALRQVEREVESLFGTSDEDELLAMEEETREEADRKRKKMERLYAEFTEAYDGRLREAS